MDYKNPNYTIILAERSQQLAKLRANKELLAASKVHYATHPWDFIYDWGMTYDPRALSKGRITNVPFIPFERQTEFMRWIRDRWLASERGLVEKSRDMGVTWLAVEYALVGYLFVPGFSAGFGSRKEELVDKRGDPKTIFEKIRFQMELVPDIFLPEGYSEQKHSSHMRLVNPETGASIIGEAGDNIGRGGRNSIYFVDEAAFIERQELVDRALSQTTDCQIDISTPNGSGNAFYNKRQRFNNTPQVFIFDWRQDPRKDQEWYEKQKREETEVTVAQEIDRDYNASQEDSFIEAKWVAAAVNAHERLGFEPIGIRVTGFDPADTGDGKAIVNRHGSVLTEADQITDGDITYAIPWAFKQADDHRSDVLRVDGDGMGAPTMKMALNRLTTQIAVKFFHGGGGVIDPDKKLDPSDKDSKTNKETYLNLRSQAWSTARARFKATYDAVTRAEAGQIVNADPEDLISISLKCKCLMELQAELSRPQRKYTPNGKIKVESKADMKSRGVDSPNLADAAVMAIETTKPEKKKTRINIIPREMADPSMGY